MAMMTFAGIRNRRFRVSKEATPDALESATGENNNEYAYKMVKIAGIVTILPFLFCLGNFFYDPALSDFNLEYGPHLAHPALRTTSVIQAILVFSAVLWREKYRSDPIDRLFAWLFVPEAATHILLHWFSHHHAFVNFAFAYAFSAGIALPGFLSLLCYVPKEKKLPWLYLVLYMVTQIPIIAGLTDMVGPAKMRLNYANINTACITTPFFYGILKRWKDVPKAPVVLATLTISYQVAMGIMGPITGASNLKLYDPSCIFQHGVVDIGFGIAYAVSIVCGVFRPKVPRPAWDWECPRDYLWMLSKSSSIRAGFLVWPFLKSYWWWKSWWDDLLKLIDPRQNWRWSSSFGTHHFSMFLLSHSCCVTLRQGSGSSQSHNGTATTSQARFRARIQSSFPIIVAFDCWRSIHSTFVLNAYILLNACLAL